MSKNVIDLTNRIFIRPKEIAELVGVSKSTVYRLVAAGKFPKQVLMSERCVGWRRADVEAYINKLDKAG